MLLRRSEWGFPTMALRPSLAQLGFGVVGRLSSPSFYAPSSLKLRQTNRFGVHLRYDISPRGFQVLL